MTTKIPVTLVLPDGRRRKAHIAIDASLDTVLAAMKEVLAMSGERFRVYRKQTGKAVNTALPIKSVGIPPDETLYIRRIGGPAHEPPRLPPALAAPAPPPAPSLSKTPPTPTAPQRSDNEVFGPALPGFQDETAEHQDAPDDDEEPMPLLLSPSFHAPTATRPAPTNKTPPDPTPPWQAPLPDPFAAEKLPSSNDAKALVPQPAASQPDDEPGCGSALVGLIGVVVVIGLIIGGIYLVAGDAIADLFNQVEIIGTWQNPDAILEVITFNPDGTFEYQGVLRSGSGTYDYEDDTIRLDFEHGSDATMEVLSLSGSSMRVRISGSTARFERIGY